MGLAVGATGGDRCPLRTRWPISRGHSGRSQTRQRRARGRLFRFNLSSRNFWFDLSFGKYKIWADHNSLPNRRHGSPKCLGHRDVLVFGVTVAVTWLGFGRNAENQVLDLTEGPCSPTIISAPVLQPTNVSATMIGPSTVKTTLAIAYGTATPRTGVLLSATSQHPLTAASTVIAPASAPQRITGFMCRTR